MKPVLLHSIFLFLAFSLQAQKASFSLELGAGYTPQGKFSSTSTREYIFIQQYQDTLAIQTDVTQQVTYNQTYQSKLSPLLMLNMRLQLKNKLYLQTGWGLQRSKFQQTDKLDFGTRITNGSDTTKFNFGNLGGGTSCVFTNSFSDLGSAMEGTSYQSLNLVIPVLLSTDIVDGRLRLSAGARIQMPVFSSKKWENIGYKENPLDNPVTCTWLIKKYDDRSGAEIRNVQVLGHAQVAYQVHKNIWVQAQVQQQFSNFFAEPQVIEFTFQEEVKKQFKPVSLGLSVMMEL
jgi:hypothetical protein